MNNLVKNWENERYQWMKISIKTRVWKRTIK